VSADELRGLAALRRGEQPAAPATQPKAGLTSLCGSDDGPCAVTSVPELVLHDAAREKELHLRLCFPAANGPYPVLVFAHGATGTKDDYQPLVRHWVSHGYVCIQANHSDSRALTGVGGHSFGAHTAQLIAGATTIDPTGRRTGHADPRPRAFVLISPQGRGAQLDDRSWRAVTRPFLAVTGAHDVGRSGEAVDWRLDPFRLAPASAKQLLWVEGAHHDFGGIGGGVRYTNAGPANPNHLAYVKTTTLAFRDAHLKDDAVRREDAVDRLGPVPEPPLTERAGLVATRLAVAIAVELGEALGKPRRLRPTRRLSGQGHGLEKQQETAGCLDRIHDGWCTILVGWTAAGCLPERLARRMKIQRRSFPGSAWPP